MKEERKTTILRLNKPVNDILDIVHKEMKRTGRNISKNEFINEILEKNIYNDDFKVLCYEGEPCSFLDIEEVDKYVKNYISKYKYKLKNKFQKDNHIDKEGSLHSSGFLCLPGIVEEGRDINNQYSFYIEQKKLEYALDIGIDKEDIPNKLKKTIIDSLVKEMCEYVKKDDIFYKLNDSKDEQLTDVYYKFCEFKLTKEEIENIKNIEVILYRENEGGLINDVGFCVEDKLGNKIEDTTICDVNYATEEDVLDYLSSCFGFDLRKFESILSIEEEIDEE